MIHRIDERITRGWLLARVYVAVCSDVLDRVSDGVRVLRKLAVAPLSDAMTEAEAEWSLYGDSRLTSAYLTAMEFRVCYFCARFAQNCAQENGDWVCPTCAEGTLFAARITRPR